MKEKQRKKDVGETEEGQDRNGWERNIREMNIGGRMLRIGKRRGRDRG